MSLRELSDRDLCLLLAERLGWLYDDGDRDHLNMPASYPTVGGPEWLLTPAGAFAVLDAMRERGWEYVITQRVVDFDDGNRRYRARIVAPDAIARAIDEAACAALGVEA